MIFAQTLPLTPTQALHVAVGKVCANKGHFGDNHFFLV